MSRHRILPQPTAARRAFSVLEVIIALVLLSATASAVGRFAFEVQKGLQERELANCFAREIENAAERIRSWDTAELSVMQIESMPMPDAISSRVTKPRWRAKVTPLTTPIAGLEIEIRIECHIYGQLATPEKQTFWIAREVQGADEGGSAGEANSISVRENASGSLRRGGEDAE